MHLPKYDFIFINVFPFVSNAHGVSLTAGNSYNVSMIKRQISYNAMLIEVSQNCTIKLGHPAKRCNAMLAINVSLVIYCFDVFFLK